MKIDAKREIIVTIEEKNQVALSFEVFRFCSGQLDTRHEGPSWLVSVLVIPELVTAFLHATWSWTGRGGMRQEINVVIGVFIRRQRYISDVSSASAHYGINYLFKKNSTHHNI